MSRACVCGSTSCNHGRRRTPPRTQYLAPYQTERRRILQQVTSDTTCWLCGGYARAGDPWETDHVLPVALGGEAHMVLRVAHRSCNRRRGGETGRAVRKFTSTTSTPVVPKYSDFPRKYG